MKPQIWQSECKLYTVFLSTNCLIKMSKMACFYYPNEVGSSLIGFFDKSLGLSVLDLAPLPSDSIMNNCSFVRGIAGMREYYEQLQKVSNGKQHYIGEWHSHPDESPTPSHLDSQTQIDIVTDRECAQILIMIGYTLSKPNEIGVFVYSKEHKKIELSKIEGIDIGKLRLSLAANPMFKAPLFTPNERDKNRKQIRFL